MNKHIVFALALITASCSESGKRPSKISEIDLSKVSTKNMNAGKEAYDLYIPENWQSERKTLNGVQYHFLFAPKTAEDPNTQVNIVSERMQGLSLYDYRQQSMESILKMIPGATMLINGQIETADTKGMWYSYRLQTDNTDATLVCYIIPRNGVAYSLTAGTQTKDAYRYRPLFDSIARSFRFL